METIIEYGYGLEVNMELLNNSKNMDIYINYNPFDTIKIINNKLYFYEIVSKNNSKLDSDYFEFNEKEQEEFENENNILVNYYINIFDIEKIEIEKYPNIHIEFKSGNEIYIKPTIEDTNYYTFEYCSSLEYIIDKGE